MVEELSTNDTDTLWVVTAEQPGTRSRRRAVELKVEELSGQVNRFLDQTNGLMDKTPQDIGPFRFVEFEVYAEISGQGRLQILGTGVEAGASGGLKFVFRRP